MGPHWGMRYMTAATTAVRPLAARPSTSSCRQGRLLSGCYHVTVPRPTIDQAAADRSSLHVHSRHYTMHYPYMC